MASKLAGCSLELNPDQHHDAGKLVGDTLLAAAFVSYAGPFTLPFRRRLVEEQWTPDLVARSIPLSDGFQPLHMLASDASKVREGLRLCTP